MSKSYIVSYFCIITLSIVVQIFFLDITEVMCGINLQKGKNAYNTLKTKIDRWSKIIYTQKENSLY